MNKTSLWLKKFFPKKDDVDSNTQPSASYKCPGCGRIINLDYEIKEPRIFTCPYCNQKGIIKPAQQKPIAEEKGSSEPNVTSPALDKARKKITAPGVEVKILGVVLIIVGIILHFIFNLVSLKVSAVTIIIGIIIFTFIPSNRKISLHFNKTLSKEKPKNDLNRQGSSLIDHLNNTLIKPFDISEKIAILLILWIVFIYMFTGLNDIDIFFIFVYLGILFMKVFSTEYISSQLKKRINVFTVAFLFIFIIIIARRILTIVNI